MLTFEKLFDWAIESGFEVRLWRYNSISRDLWHIRFSYFGQRGPGSHIEYSALSKKELFGRIKFEAPGITLKLKHIEMGK